MQEQPKSIHDSLHTFAAGLTSKVREFEKMEREGRLLPEQSAEILEQMIEAQLYAMFKTLLYSSKATRQDVEAAKKALEILNSSRLNNSAFTADMLSKLNNEVKQ